MPKKSMKNRMLVLKELKMLSAEEVLELLVEAHTDGKYERGLRVKVFHRAVNALYRFLMDVERVKEKTRSRDNPCIISA